MDEEPRVSGKRAMNREEVRTRIEEALLEAMASGDSARLNHDRIAEAAGVARRTVYRYYPDRDALMQAVWDRVTSTAGPNVRFPESEAELLSTLPDIYTGFDNIAPLATIVRSTPQGRAVRLAQRDRRVESYTQVAADAVKHLPEKDRLLATAMLQFLHTSAWLELRDQWDLAGEDIAVAAGWAIRTLLRDLRARGDLPLSEDRGTGSA